MQPMMVINSGHPLPEVAAVAAARQIWRCRSELAPFAAALLVAGLGWCTRVAAPQWWPLILAGSAAAALALAAFGAGLGLAARQERLYAAVTVLACGTWDALAAALGPLASPLPQALCAGGVVLSVPWWANRRRRAKVRVERTIAAWPDIAQAVGLAGSQVMAATVDRWGWRARLRLARGQTITDVMAKIPAIESGLGTHRNAVRVHPTADDLANRCELRVLDRDPHAGAIPWHGPSVTSITEPIDLGPFEDAEPCRVLLLRRHVIIGGATGSGKSGGLNDLLANLVACRDVVIWAIDLKGGMEILPWAACIDRLATTPRQAAALLADATAILHARAQYLAGQGRRVWEPAERMPSLVIIIDEYAELAEQVPGATKHTDTIARLGRATAETLIIATQRPTQKVMGQGAVRSQMNIRIAFRVEEKRDVDLILGQGMRAAGWHADKLNAPGKFLLWSPEHAHPSRARAYLITDADVTRAVNDHAHDRPRLDAISRDALTAAAPHLPPPAEPGQAGTRDDADDDEGRRGEDADDYEDPETILRAALSLAPDAGLSVPELVTITRMSRRWVYYRLNELAADGKVTQTARGQWRLTPASGRP
jgi:S-DNA-T family DNA segregation ATPase FtsK/SpoIIIE